jgi:hypothetical protein
MKVQEKRHHSKNGNSRPLVPVDENGQDQDKLLNMIRSIVVCDWLQMEQIVFAPQWQ